MSSSKNTSKPNTEYTDVVLPSVNIDFESELLNDHQYVRNVVVRSSLMVLKNIYSVLLENKLTTASFHDFVRQYLPREYECHSFDTLFREFGVVRKNEPTTQMVDTSVSLSSSKEPTTQIAEPSTQMVDTTGSLSSPKEPTTQTVESETGASVPPAPIIRRKKKTSPTTTLTPIPMDDSTMSNLTDSLSKLAVDEEPPKPPTVKRTKTTKPAKDETSETTAEPPARKKTTKKKETTGSSE